MVALAIPIASPTVPVVPILVSSLDLEDSDDLVFIPLQSVGEDVIAYSFSEGGDFDMSSGEVNIALRFMTLG